MTDQQALIEWRDRTPVSQRFDDPYFSLEDGLAETRHVFLAGNDLPGRFRKGFHIAELGFGTGLNFLTALEAWKTAGLNTPLHFTSFEAFPLDPQALARALGAFPTLDIQALTAVYKPHSFRVETRYFTLELIKGDARARLPKWPGSADAWFLDGFSPAKNPELWEPALMTEIARHTAPDGSCATYTAAGHVRRALEAAGFDITRAPGFGRKRHMTRGVLR